jgi:large subunit ribosomal protein L5
MAPRLKEKYWAEVVPALKEQLALGNVNEVPRLEKIVVNMGVGAAVQDSKQLDAAIGDMRTITGQQPTITRAKKSIAGFKIRQGMPIGAKVTLRGDRMGVHGPAAGHGHPAVRDFRGRNPNL